MKNATLAETGGGGAVKSEVVEVEEEVVEAERERANGQECDSDQARKDAYLSRGATPLEWSLNVVLTLVAP